MLTFLPYNLIPHAGFLHVKPRDTQKWAMLAKTGIQWLRPHTWTEDNRLQTVTDNEWFSYYQYDAGGDRTYKLPYNRTISNRSGRISYYWAAGDATLYASPYLVVTPKGYTKHYYAESERITSQIGRGNFSILATPVTDTATANRKVRRADSLVLALNPAITDTAAQLSYLTTLTNRQKDTCEAYWYHTDHLGSSSWITDSAGSPVQHLHYLPWGEGFVDQRLNDFEGVRYTFSAKEKDAETGYSYFGSRYYNSDLSIWLSVDPMAHKYPSMSPYVYCANNPVRLVDPNGDTLVIIGGNGNHYKYVPGGDCPEGVDYPTSQYWNRLNDLNNNKAGKVIVGALHSDKTTYYISNNSKRGDNTGRFSEKTNTAYMGGHYSKTGDLAHELFHAFQKKNGQGGESIHNEVEAFMFQSLIDNDYFPLSQKPEMNGINSQYNSAVFNLFDNNDVDNFDTYFNIISKGFKKNALINKDGLYQGMKDSLPNQKNNLVKQFFSHE